MWVGMAAVMVLMVMARTFSLPSSVILDTCGALISGAGEGAWCCRELSESVEGGGAGGGGGVVRCWDEGGRGGGGVVGRGGSSGGGVCICVASERGYRR